MKKFLLIFSLAVLLTSNLFAGFFDKRFFEMKVGTDVSFSNNVISANDILKKDLVIDLRKIADETPESGLNIFLGAQPTYELNVNILNVTVGVHTGLDVYEKMTISKDLFDLLGKGNAKGEVIEVGLNNYLDAFGHADLNVGFKIAKFNIYARPCLFVPLASAYGRAGKVSLLNNDDGDVIANLNMDFNIYTPINLKDPSKIDISDFGWGVDLEAGASLPLTRRVTLSADTRIPLMPGEFKKVINMKYNFDYKVNVQKMSDAKEPESTSPEFSDPVEALYKINRPIFLNGYIDYMPIGKLLDLRAGAGFGVNHPFMEDAFWYPQYYLGMKLNLINLFKLGLSTEYTKENFKHQAAVTLNLRLIQLDLGVSAQSASFIKSFASAGLGAFAYVTVGF